MTVRLSAAIMAHPTRRPHAEALQTKIGHGTPIIYDPNPRPSPDPMQRWHTGRRAWQAHHPDANWHLVIQDDALISRDLIPALTIALEQLPTDERDRPQGIVSPYAGTGRPDQYNVTRAITRATSEGHTWWSTRSLNWGVAIAAPTWTIPGMLTWCSTPTRHRRKYDQRIGLYYRDMLRWRTWYTNPSLVEHAGLPSLVGHDTGPTRRAHNFHPGSALTIDWTHTPPGGLTTRIP